ncbi:MAG: BrnA antitoxin family protein [Chloroflexi bacterium]|nr:BrnA antitoxin family protein [Chloroflexota bacterium]MBU1660768.1 BrnA antitoxin family protein [Chloroflexota bacterium]
MNENNENIQTTSISNAHTLEEIADFWDTHSLADYEDQTHEVEFDVRANRRRRVMLDPDIYMQLETTSLERGISPETLVNLWLVEQLQKLKEIA